MSSRNSVTIFSNGIADHVRSFAVSKGSATSIEIPVKKGDIGDILASLNVYGPVKVTRPASYRPEDEKKGSLSLDAGNAFHSLVTGLSGSSVVVRASGADESLAGKLVGLHHQQAGTQGEPIREEWVVVLVDGALRKVPLRDVVRLEFKDDAVNAEIAKALQHNFQRIKPDSTILELQLSADEDTEALVQYTIPAAAWKMSYRLRRGDGDLEFQGLAIVDNNTDEDWNEVDIAVVIGEPITFSTDLARAKVPGREHRNVVADRAVGAVEVEEPAAVVGGVKLALSQTLAMSSGEVLRSLMDGGEDSLLEEEELESASMDDAETRDVGDFAVFRSRTPATIAAQRSAVIPMFTTTLEDSRVVLHYKHGNHAQRPFRAIAFTNETKQSLGRGVCTVYDGGIFAGSCIMPATKPGGDAILPHALETGVRVVRSQSPKSLRNVALKLSEGVLYQSIRQTCATTYRVFNQNDEPFDLLVDHDHELTEPAVEVVRRSGDQAEEVDTESLSSGLRLSLVLKEREALSLELIETRIVESRLSLAHRAGYKWLDQHVAANGPLVDDAMHACLSIQKRIDEKERGLAAAMRKEKTLEAKQERLRKNIATGQGTQADAWREQLAASERELTEIAETMLPQVGSERDVLVEELENAIRGLAIEWSE